MTPPVTPLRVQHEVLKDMAVVAGELVTGLARERVGMRDHEANRFEIAGHLGHLQALWRAYLRAAQPAHHDMKGAVS